MILSKRCQLLFPWVLYLQDTGAADPTDMLCVCECVSDMYTCICTYVLKLFWLKVAQASKAELQIVLPPQLIQRLKLPI